MTQTDETPIETLLRRQIAADGPVSVADFMGLALGHPTQGYYVTRDPLGREGDFTTAPEISQMFGELVGLWCAQSWMDRGRSGPVTLIELGPGRGTLMADMLRALAIVPDLLDVLTVRLVETSPVLTDRQRDTLAAFDTVPIHWHGTPAAALDAADGFLVIVANEFFDALPVRQFVRGDKGWHERMVGLSADDRLDFVVAPDPVPLPPLAYEPDAPAGAVREWGRSGEAIVATCAEAIQGGDQGGIMLVVDYGHAQSAPGDTLQAVRDHAFHPPLEAPGTADLTAHVDFAALAAAVETTGARVHGPLTQGDFLAALGIEARAKALVRHADPQQQLAITSALARLTSPEAMGRLFKALALTDSAAPPPPAFPAPPATEPAPSRSPTR